MPKVTFKQPDGAAATVEAVAGTSVMEAAIDNGIDGIIAECGGACSCATCHVYVDAQWLPMLQAPDAQEDGMLDCVLDRRENSRLSCQIPVDDDLDGLVVEIPEAQL
jgi:ferredoxin, 2Fe-2S